MLTRQGGWNEGADKEWEGLARSKSGDGLWRGKGLKPELEMGGGLLGAQMEMGTGGAMAGRENRNGDWKGGIAFKLVSRNLIL